MSATAIRAPRGTLDLLGPAAAAHERVRARAAALFASAGYEQIETPAFEATELFVRGVGQATDIVEKEMYTFEDGSGRSLTLRPEGTAPVCRAYIEHGMHKRPAPVKLWYWGPFFRYERAQSGRYRQFFQVGAEAFGSADPGLDAELIALLVTLAQELDLRGLKLRIASLGTSESRAAYRQELSAFLRAHQEELPPEVRARIDTNPLRAFDAKDSRVAALMERAPLLLDRLSAQDAEHFAAVRELLDGAGIDYVVDPRLVRGLDYYTRTVFELSSSELGAQSGVGGGGRYDRLIEQLGGPPTPAIGFAAGIERLLLAAGERGASAEDRAPALYIAFAGGPPRSDERLRAFALWREALAAGIAAQVELCGRTLKRALAHADRIGVRHVAIIEGEELVLRDMRTRAQRACAAAELLYAIAQERG
jgi:histidyl-tRNA synthetase